MIKSKEVEQKLKAELDEFFISGDDLVLEDYEFTVEMAARLYDADQSVINRKLKKNLYDPEKNPEGIFERRWISGKNACYVYWRRDKHKLKERKNENN